MSGAVIRTTLVAMIAIAALVLLGGCGRTTLQPPAAGGSGDVVRGGIGGFLFAAEGGPDVPLGSIDPAAMRDQVRRSQAAVDPAHDDLFGLAIAATFPTAEAASSAAADLRDVLAQDEAWFADAANPAARASLLDPDRDAPISAAAADWLAAANLAPGTRGIGWAGRAAGPGRPADSVWTIGRTVIVTGLKAEILTSPEAPPIHPVAHRWAAAGANVLLEGDRAGEGAILTDLACRPGAGAGDDGSALRDTIGDQVVLGQWSPRPPWVAEPTAEQVRARREIARYQELAVTAAADPEILDLFQRIAAADEDQRQALMDELSKRILVRIERETNGRVDPEIAALLARQPMTTDPDEAAELERAIGTRIGQVELRPNGQGPTADALGPVAYTGSVRVAHGRLEIGWLALARVSTGLPSLAAWLTERGCTDAVVRLTDVDAVRA